MHNFSYNFFNPFSKNIWLQTPFTTGCSNRRHRDNLVPVNKSEITSYLWSYCDQNRDTAKKHIIGFISCLSGNMGVWKVIYPSLTQGSSVCRPFLENPSYHYKLEDYGSGHVLWFYSLSLCNNLFKKNWPYSIHIIKGV